MSNSQLYPTQVAKNMRLKLELKDSLRFSTKTKYNAVRIDKFLARYDNDIDNGIKKLELFRTMSFTDSKLAGQSAYIPLTSYKLSKTRHGVDLILEFNDLTIRLSTVYRNSDSTMCKKFYSSEISVVPLAVSYPNSFIGKIKNVTYELVLVDNDDMFGREQLVVTEKIRIKVKDKIKILVNKLFRKK